jgi:hypothetical protein
MSVERSLKWIPLCWQFSASSVFPAKNFEVVAQTIRTDWRQGCQMDYFQQYNNLTHICNIGKFWRVLQWQMLVYVLYIQPFGLFYVHLVHVIAIWSILRPFGICYSHLV